jgi:hypothetical protein
MIIALVSKKAGPVGDEHTVLLCPTYHMVNNITGDHHGLSSFYGLLREVTGEIRKLHSHLSVNDVVRL